MPKPSAPRAQLYMSEHAQLITHALRRAGCLWCDASRVGGGFPQLIVSRAGVNYLLAIKPPGQRHALTPEEWAFRDRWRGPYAVVTSADEALEAVGL